MDMTTYTLIIEAAQRAANLVYEDADRPDRLAPANYEGDGEAWHFDWIEGHLGPALRDESKECYLAAFWIEIRRLQDN